jgi:enoyl-CoA hydratase/carnithine racemase
MFIPAEAGQPALRSAWTAEAVNASSGNFYRNTAQTLESAWVRPRHHGYIAWLKQGLDHSSGGLQAPIPSSTFCRTASPIPGVAANPSEYAMTDVTLAIANHVATITIDRPHKLNAMTPAMISALQAHARTINETREVWVAVLRASGDSSFCAGSDVGGLDDYADPIALRDRPDYCDAVRGINKPVVCAINGYTFGGGLEMALSADIRIASPNARFAAPEIKLGWIGGGDMTFLLAHTIGPSNAALMILTGDPIDSDKALACGLVSEIVPLPELHKRADAIACTIASRGPRCRPHGQGQFTRGLRHDARRSHPL